MTRRSIVAAIAGVAIARLAGAAPGNLDPTFGTGGIAAFPHAAADDVARLPDGRYLVATHGHVERRLPDGAPDPSFGNHGRSRKLKAPAERIALANDGSIVVAGNSRRGALVGRLTPEGLRDDAFGDRGIVDLALIQGARARAVALDSLGRIVVLWDGSIGGFARLLPDGPFDASFGSGGKVADVQITSHPQMALAIQPDDRILGSMASAILRFTVDGGRDASFGTNGLVSVGLSNLVPMYVAALVVLPDGRILAGGHETHFPYGQSDGLAFTRLAADGTVDTTFGPAGNGLAITAIGEYAVTTAMAVDAAGRIVATGYAETDELPEDNPDYDVLVVRYDADGHLDATFGAGGTIATDIAGRQVGDWGLGLVLEPGGIVVAARSFRSATSSRTNGSLLRYLAD